MNKKQNSNNAETQQLNIAGVRQSFSVYSYIIGTKDMQTYCHWSEGLNMVIEKNGVEVKLNGEELKQVVASLPRTIGGSY
jgi:cytochrome c oxidase subunit IV